jgi:hypothetical protein
MFGRARPEGAAGDPYHVATARISHQADTPLGILAEIVQMGQIFGDIGNPRVITGVA